MLYIVQPGDTLPKIAALFTIGLADYAEPLAKLNGYPSADKTLVPGEVIEIPDNWLKPALEFEIAGTSGKNGPYVTGVKQQGTVPGMPTGVWLAVGVGLIAIALVSSDAKGRKARRR